MTRMVFVEWLRLILEWKANIDWESVANLDEDSYDSHAVGFTECIFQTAVVSRVPVDQMKLETKKICD